VTTFAGNSTASGGAAATTTATAGAAPVGVAPPGSIGSLTMVVAGTFPNTAHFDPVAQWIDGLTASPMFTPPGVSSVANAPNGANTNVTFASNLFLTPYSNLVRNAGS
jgi:hypothetical protein